MFVEDLVNSHAATARAIVRPRTVEESSMIARTERERLVRQNSSSAPHCKTAGGEAASPLVSSIVVVRNRNSGI